MNFLFPGYSPSGALHFLLPLIPETCSLSVEYVDSIDKINQSLVRTNRKNLN